MDGAGIGIEKAWRSTCRVLFGQELGNYADFEPWLAEFVDKPALRKSVLSGKPVIHSTSDYPAQCRSISLDEVDFDRKFMLDINRVKDIDSLISAVGDRFFYSGNVVLGNSSQVVQSSNVVDSFCVRDSNLIGNSKYMAYCTQCWFDRYGFGSNAFSECEFCLKCHELTRVKRSFELWMSQDSSDCYYSHSLKGCSNCFFCFNLQNRHNCIGNVQLESEEYQKIKARLLVEMVGAALKNKRLPSLLEIVGKSKPEMPKIAPPPAATSPSDKSKIEAAFFATMKVIFGASSGKKIDFYGKWLANHTHGLTAFSSCASSVPVYLAHYGNWSDFPKNRLLTVEEARLHVASLRISPDEAKNISLKNAHQSIGKIAFFTTGIEDGQNHNDLECAINIDAVNCYRSVCSVYSKYCGYSFWPQGSEHLFGCDIMFYSGFCINCYHSNNLQRCAECDSCSNCSDCLYCHNCENLRDCMFCFNAKNKRYAIGNVEVGKEEFMRVKRMVLREMQKQLDTKGMLMQDIFGL